MNAVINCQVPSWLRDCWRRNTFCSVYRRRKLPGAARSEWRWKETPQRTYRDLLLRKCLVTRCQDLRDVECRQQGFCSWEKVLASTLLYGKILPTRFTNRPRRHVTYRLLQDSSNYITKWNVLHEAGHCPQVFEIIASLRTRVITIKIQTLFVTLQLVYDRIFTGGTFSGAVRNSGYTAVNDRMIDELERMRKEGLVVFCLRNCRTLLNLSIYWCPGWVLKPSSPKYKSQALPLPPACSVELVTVCYLTTLLVAKIIYHRWHIEYLASVEWY